MERFAANVRGWPDDPTGTTWLADGGYQIFTRTPARFVAVGAPLPDLLRDVTVSATFRKLGGPTGGGYGLIIRDQGPGPRDGNNQAGHYWVLEVADTGLVGVWKRAGDHWIDLLPWTPANAVRPGPGANELTAVARGKQITFLVNGVVVATLEDQDPVSGTVGVFVGGDLNRVVLDEFSVAPGPTT
jgi:hypothetical protein